MVDITLSGFGDNIYAGSISADRIFYNDAVGFYDPQSVTNQNRLTNADRIRAMSDEELAEWLWFKVGKCPPFDVCPSQYIPCEPKDCWFDWLKEKVDDGK